MTKKERAQVVELLKCAADAMRVHGRLVASDVPRMSHEAGLEPLCLAAEVRAAEVRRFDFWSGDQQKHADVLLEAAQLVAEGWSPTRTGGRR